MFKPTIFREYDIRGAADVELLDDDVEQLGRAFGTYLQRHQGKRISLGRDTRLSSPRLRDALMRGLKASGCDFHDLAQSIAPASDFAWRGMVARCVAHAHRLSDREAKFVCDMNRWVGEPTEPQRNWLTAIFAKIERGRGAS